MPQAAMAHLFLIEDEGPVRDQLCLILPDESGDPSRNEQKGIAVLRGIRAHPHQVAVLILTGYGSDEAEALAQTLGIDRRLMQRFFLHELEAAVEAMIGRLSDNRSWQ